MVEQSETRPLVTFALFHYNQEALVADAMAAALAQDYTPLEVIVSDDCSTDGTWDAIQKVAADYDGPHALRIVRNDSNMGIGPHVGRVGLMARGELIVQADGDDLSAPNRVSRMVEAWMANGKTEGVLHSDARMPGKVSNDKPDPEKSNLEYFVKNQFRGMFYGSVAAYTRDVFRRFPPLSSGFEDVALNFRALLIGRVIYVDEVLVDYNLSEVSVSHPIRMWQRDRGERWFNSIYRNIEGMEADYIHHLKSEGLQPDARIVQQLNAVKRKINIGRGILSYNPVRIARGMSVYPYGVTFRQWFGFYRTFFGLR